MARPAFERLQVYQLSEAVADTLWDVVTGWSPFARDSAGKQLVRAADSIGVNIAEGYGRGTPLDNRKFVRTARGSLDEVTHFLRRAHRRKLVSAEQTAALIPLLDELGPKLNAYLKSIVNDCRKPDRRVNGQPTTERPATHNPRPTT